MVVGEGFVNHQEHDAGEEGQSQDNENGDLGDNTDGQPVSVRERHYGCMLLKGNPYTATRSLFCLGWNHFAKSVAQFYESLMFIRRKGIQKCLKYTWIYEDL